MFQTTVGIAMKRDLQEQPHMTQDSTGPSEAHEEYFTVRQVAQMLQIARGKAYELLSDGSLKGVVINQRTIRIRRSDLDSYLADRDYMTLKRH